MKKFLLLLLLFIFTKEDVSIDPKALITDNSCYTFDDYFITLTRSEVYKLVDNSNSERGLIISSTGITLNLNGVQISTTGTSTPIIIKQNCVTTITFTGSNTLQDSEQNLKNSVIYMESGSQLTINVDILYINPSKGIGIYGDQSTNLIINGGVISIGATKCTGFIDIGNDLTINNGNIDDSNLEDSIDYTSLKAGGSINIQYGTFIFHSIQAENDIILGPKNPSVITENMIDMKIGTVNEGMKAKSIGIYYGLINIVSEKDSISSYRGIEIKNSKLDLKAGSLDTKSSPFIQNGELKIFDSSMKIYGTNCLVGKINNNHASISYNEIPAPENSINIFIGDHFITSLESDELYTYFYWTNSEYQLAQQNEIKIKINGEKVKSFDNSTCVKNKKKKKNSNNSKILKISSYLYFFISLILF